MTNSSFTFRVGDLASPSGFEDGVILSGQVRDGAEDIFKKILTLVKARTSLSIDLGGLNSMSSIGAAAWVRFVEELSSTHKVRLFRCPIFFVDYLNMFDAFRKGVEIRSLELPYACPTCGYQESKFMDLADLSIDKNFESIDCPECDGIMDCLVASEDYLAFTS